MLRPGGTDSVCTRAEHAPALRLDLSISTLNSYREILPSHIQSAMFNRSENGVLFSAVSDQSLHDLRRLLYEPHRYSPENEMATNSCSAFTYTEHIHYVLTTPRICPGHDPAPSPRRARPSTGMFLDYWNTHGGLAQQGFPISDEMQRQSDTDGKTYTVQYFERAVFELHPENAAAQRRAALPARHLPVQAEIPRRRARPDSHTNNPGATVHRDRQARLAASSSTTGTSMAGSPSRATPSPTSSRR